MTHMTGGTNPLIHRLGTRWKWPILHPTDINLGKETEWAILRLWPLQSVEDRIYPYSYRESNDDPLVVQMVV